MTAKRIAIFINSLGGGGAERVCVTVANGLYRCGHDVDVVVFSLEGGVMRPRLNPGVNVVNLGCKRAALSPLPILRYLIRRPPNAALVFNRQITVILVVCRRFVKRFRLVSRNIIFLSAAAQAKRGLWHGVIVNILVRLFYGRSDAFIAQSKAMAIDLAAYLRIPEEKIVTIPNPLSEEFTSDNVRGQPEHRYILCIGRLDPQKAFDYAIRAFASLSEDFPELRLRIVGEGAASESLQKLADDLNLRGRIDFVGFQRDVAQIYRNANLTLLTSRYEGFPNVLIESIALGTPVVAFDCPSGPAEIIEDGINGYLVPSEDEFELRRSLRRALMRGWDRAEIRRTATKYWPDGVVLQYARTLDL